MALVEKSQMLTFERGLNREFDVAEPGAAKRLINWQPTPYGGLKVRRQWQEASKTGLPLDRKIIGCVAAPVAAGYELLHFRQRARTARKGSNVVEIERKWWFETFEGSYLVACLSYVNYNDGGSAHTATSAITVTPPAGWVPLATVHGNDAPSSISARIYAFPDGGNRSGSEKFTFGDRVRRAQLTLFEVRGVDNAAALDKLKSNSGHSITPNTDISEQTTVEREVAIGVVAARTKDKSIKQTEITPGWTSHYDPKDPPQRSFGVRDEWLNHMTARIILTQTQTLELSSVLGESEDEDDAKSRWVALFVTLKAKLRSADDKDYYIVDHAKTAAEHELYIIDQDELAAGSWAPVQGNFLGQPQAVIPGDTENQRLSFAAGMGAVVITAPDIGTPAVRERMAIWDGTLLVGIRNKRAMHSVAFWKNRFWGGGMKDHPNRLYWSALGDPTSWILGIPVRGAEDSQEQDLPGGPGYIDIGNAAEWLWDIAPANEGLLCAQRDALHFFSGAVSGPQVITLAGGGGSRGKCICPVPGGAVIAGEQNIWLWQGGAPQIISRALDDWWVNPARRWTYTAFVNNKVYIMGADEDTCAVYDLEQQHWWIDKPPLPPQFLYSWDGRELLTGYDSDVRAVDFQHHPDGLRSMDEGATEQFEVLTHELMLGSPGRPATPKWLHIAYQKRDTMFAHPPLVVTPIYDGVEQTPREVTYFHEPTMHERLDGDHRIRVDVGVRDKSAMHKVQYKITWGEVGWNPIQRTVWDIEGLELIYDIEELR